MLVLTYCMLFLWLKMLRGGLQCPKLAEKVQSSLFQTSGRSPLCTCALFSNSNFLTVQKERLWPFLCVYAFLFPVKGLETFKSSWAPFYFQFSVDYLGFFWAFDEFFVVFPRFFEIFLNFFGFFSPFLELSVIF